MPQMTNIPVSEVYWSLVDKADKKFSKIRDLPFYERNRYDTYFSKVFKVYTQLWKFQQENRQKLVEAGLKRWEIGDIASRIGQLYFGQYMRTSDASYLSESYIFYEAVLSREYFKDGLAQDVNLANKQLRFLARFLMVCLVLNRREMVYQLVNQLKMLIDECKRNFVETDFKEWKLVVQEIVKFLKADTPFMNIRPLRYSLVLDLHPDLLSQVVATKRKLRLRDAILTSCYPNEVKFSELTLDTFRLLQSLEWDPSGSFYKPNGDLSYNTNGPPGPGRINMQDITDPTLPPNPRKAVLYRPSITQFIAVLATICEELPPDGILLVYLSAMGKGDGLSYQNSCLHIGTRGTGDCIYPCDFIPFTRRPLFFIIDSDSSKAFKTISGTEKGEPVAMLLSPSSSPPMHGTVDSSQQISRSLFTCFLTAPLQAFCLLIGMSGNNMDMDLFNKADKILTSSFNEWGELLTTSNTLHPAWAQVLFDPFLRRLLLRYIFCEAILTLYGLTYEKNDVIPECVPALPECVQPMADSVQSVVKKIADVFGVTHSFIFSQGLTVREVRSSEEDSVPAS